MKSLDELGRQFGTDKSTIGHCYTVMYGERLAPLRDKPITFLEIGLAGGKSARMWDAYFTHPKARILEMDIEVKAEARVGPYSDRVFLLTGDQGNEADLRKLARACDGFDVIVDDGGHIATAQQLSFRLLWPYLRVGGQYWIEDLETSYRPFNNRGAAQSTLDMLRGFERHAHPSTEVIFWLQLCLVLKKA
jgi:hypothetical protein